jgi:glycosyltransferase involved in cell wall biosynthesis
MRILVGADVLPDPNAGASGTVYQMNAALRRQGHVVDEIWQTDLGRRIRHGNLHYLLELPRTYRRAVRQRLNGAAYDVIELNQPHSYLAAAEHRRRRRGGVFVCRTHGHDVRGDEAVARWRKELGIPEKHGIRKWVSAGVCALVDRHWDQIARTADGFHVSSREDADFLVERYSVSRGRIGVITQGVPEVFRQTEVAPLTAERANRILYVGQYAFFKAPIILAEAVSIVLNGRPAATMTWVCSREHHADARSLLDEKIRARVTFLNWMPQDALIRVFDEHGVFLFSSFFEGFGKTPLEAMSRGLCVVAAATGGMRDYIENDISGRLTPVGQPQVMAAAALELMDDTERARKMSSAARSAALAHSWDRSAQDATAFYEALIRQKAAGHE